MKNWKVSLLVISAIVAVFCLSTSVVLAQDKTITVDGTGIITMDPDMVNVSVAINTENNSIQTAISQNTAAVDNVRKALIEAGVDEKDLITTNYSVWSSRPYYYSESAPSDEKYYSVNYYLRIIVRDVSMLNKVLDAAVNSGISNIDSVNYDYSDKTALYTEARKLALAEARAKADVIAAELGKTIVDVATVDAPEISEISDMRYNMVAKEGMGGMGGANTPELTSGAFQVAVTLKVGYIFE